MGCEAGVTARAAALSALALACASLAGCYPATRLQVPRTVPVGKATVAIALSSPLKRDPIPETYGEDAADNYPQLEFAVRTGLTDMIDVGVRGRATAVEVGPKFQLVRDVVEISIAPALLIAKDDDIFVDEGGAYPTRVVAMRTSVYVGSSMEHHVAVFVAPTLDAGTRTDGLMGTQLLLLPGAMLGVLFSPRPAVHLLVEVGMLFPVGGVSGPVGGSAGDDGWSTRLGPGDNRVELSLGVVFGRFH